MINNPVRNIHTDYVANDVFKPKDANALAMSIPFDFVITKERVDEYRETHEYTQEDWMDVGGLLWGDTDVTPDYTCGGRTAAHILINFHTTIEDRFDFGSWLSLLTVEEVHIHSLSSYRAKGTSLNIFHHTHGTENFVLFDDSNFYRSSPLHVGSFMLWDNGSGYPQWHSSAPFVYEQCLEGPLPTGASGEAGVVVRKEAWLSNGISSGGSGGSILAIVDTDFTGHYYKSGSADGSHEEVTFDTNGTGNIPFRGVGVLRGNGLESIDSIFSFGAGEDKWFDGNNANGQFRALSVDSANTIDIYTWDIIDSWSTDSTTLTKRYKNLRGHEVSWTYGTGNPPLSNSAGKPLTIDGASLEEDKVYEIRVHYMDVGSRTDSGWGTPKPSLYQVINSLPDPVSATNPLKISISTYTFTREDIETANAAICRESNFRVQFKNAEGSYYTIAKWAIQSDTPATIGTSFDVVMKYNLKNTVAQNGTLLPEIGFGSTIFFRHGMYVYVMTY